MLLDLGDGGISGNAVLLAQFCNLVNRAYDNVVSQLLQNEGDYTWDDYGNTDFPIGTTNLVASQSDYTLPASTPTADPSTFLRLIKVQAADPSGAFRNLRNVSETMSSVPLETMFSSPGFPQYYKLLGNSIFLYPAPLATQVTLIGGLRIFFQRDKIEFVVGDTTKQPGFPSIYHYLLALEASETWAAIKGLRQLTFIQQKKTEFMHNLGWGTANKNKDVRQIVRPIGVGRSYE